LIGVICVGVFLYKRKEDNNKAESAPVLAPDPEPVAPSDEPSTGEGIVSIDISPRSFGSEDIPAAPHLAARGRDGGVQNA